MPDFRATRRDSHGCIPVLVTLHKPAGAYNMGLCVGGVDIAGTPVLRFLLCPNIVFVDIQLTHEKHGGILGNVNGTARCPGIRVSNGEGGTAVLRGAAVQNYHAKAVSLFAGGCGRTLIGRNVNCPPQAIAAVSGKGRTVHQHRSVTMDGAAALGGCIVDKLGGRVNIRKCVLSKDVHRPTGMRGVVGKRTSLHVHSGCASPIRLGFAAHGEVKTPRNGRVGVSVVSGKRTVPDTGHFDFLQPYGTDICQGGFAVLEGGRGFDAIVVAAQPHVPIPAGIKQPGFVAAVQGYIFHIQQGIVRSAFKDE